MISAPIALILAFSTVSLAVSAWLAYRALPLRLDRSLRETAEIALGAEKRATQIQEAWAEERMHLNTLVEQLTDLSEVVERKRNRARSAQQRAERAETGETDIRQELRRQVGIGQGPIQ